MAKQDAAALRAAREARIAARGNSATGDQSNSKSVKSDEQGKSAASVETPKAAPASELPAILTAAVLDPSAVQKTAEVDMLLYGADSEDPHWVVVASGKPVAEIRLSDQEEPHKIAKMFVTQQYAEGVREAAKQFDFAEILTSIHARPYMASVSTADAVKTITAQAQETAAKDLRKAKADLRDNTLNMLNLVVLAQTKNFLQENPLKDELYRRMTESGVGERQAVAIIEAAYQARAADHFEACFKQASKWMDLQPAALAELEEQIKGLAYRQPVVAESDEIRSASHSPSRIHNVPLETRTASGTAHAGEEDEKENLKVAFGFRSRSLNRSMPQR
jgi:hypothetical protein